MKEGKTTGNMGERPKEPRPKGGVPSQSHKHYWSDPYTRCKCGEAMPYKETPLWLKLEWGRMERNK